MSLAALQASNGKVGCPMICAQRPSPSLRLAHRPPCSTSAAQIVASSSQAIWLPCPSRSTNGNNSSSSTSCSSSRTVRCNSSFSSAASLDRSSIDADALQPQEPIKVAQSSSNSSTARGILKRLDTYGSAEVWATSVASQFIAIQAVAQTHMLLQDRQQKGLAAVAALSASDQAVADDQKRGLRKLTLHIQKSTAVEQQQWQPGIGNHISTNKVKAVPELLVLMREQLSKPNGTVVAEARGEQAVTRALKAGLSLQAADGRQLLLQPWLGPVVDIVAEKRGQQRVADGLLLLMRWQE